MTGHSQVYMIGSRSLRRVKIGVSVNPEARLRTLQSGSLGYRLDLLATVPGTSALESVLHLWFADCRVRGEWFSFPRRDAADQLRTAVHTIGRLDDCPFDWTELYVDCRTSYVQAPRTLRDRMADRLRNEPLEATRSRLVAASGSLVQARLELALDSN